MHAGIVTFYQIRTVKVKFPMGVIKALETKNRPGTFSGSRLLNSPNQKFFFFKNCAFARKLSRCVTAKFYYSKIFRNKVVHLHFFNQKWR